MEDLLNFKNTQTTTADLEVVVDQHAAAMPSASARAPGRQVMAGAHGLDELTVNWTEGSVLKIRELDRVVLSSSTSWATLAFLFQEHDAETGTYRAPKVSVRRFRKRGGRYVVDKHLTLSGEKQAMDLARTIDAWFRPSGPGQTHEVQAKSAPRAGVIGEAPPRDDTA